MRDRALQKRVDLQAIMDIERSIGLARALRNCLLRTDDPWLTDPISRHIISSVGRLHVAVCCVLSYSCCRYSDLKSFDITGMLRGVPITIQQRKTGSGRRLPAFPINKIKGLSEVDPTAPIVLTSYDSTKEAIQKVLPRSITEALINSYDGTHIFRHLRASWLAEKGFDVELIRAWFSHGSAETTRKYIHNLNFNVV